MALTPKRALFVREYLKDFNGTQAAIRAGYAKKSADVEANRLLGIAEVAAAVEAARKKLQENVEVEASDVMRELGRIGLTDITGAYDDDGRLLPLSKMPEAVRRSIASIEVEEVPDFSAERGEDGSFPLKARLAKVRFNDKTKALELLGKCLKLFTDKIEHSGSGPVTISINGIAADPPKGKKR